MTRAGETQATRTTPRARGGRVLLKVAAWILAVPALCAAVVVGGAVPLYLLLPDAKPAAERVVEATPRPSSTSTARAAPTDAAVSEPVEALDEAPTGATTVAEAPIEDGAAPPAEAAEATVLPTPRPSAPRPYTPPQGTEPEVVSLASASPSAARRPPETARPQGAPAGALTGGRRAIVRTTAKLRAAPQGAEIGVLPEGTEVVVGRCERWCEVSVDGKRGFVHASLVGDGSAREAARPVRERPDARPGARRFEDEPRRIERREAYDRGDDERGGYERRGYGRGGYERGGYARRDEERRFQERAYRRGVDPDWLLDDPDRPSQEPDFLYDDPYR